MNYSEKIQRLRNRRQGVYAKDGSIIMDAMLAGARKTEKFTSIAEPESVKYALGAMQRVDDEYTRNTYAEGNRVRDRLDEGLSSAGIAAVFEYQGSVPLDVHVRGNSDIDLLVLHSAFMTADVDVWQQYNYVRHAENGKTPVEELWELRTEAIAILQRRYYEATVNTAGSKSICLSGGSLQRVVDVVPSHWHDTIDWKRTGDKANRDIYVLDSHKNERVRNKPFMHIRLIENKCLAVNGALRKVIRLLKNIRYDATPEIKLSSYDIAAIAWHMTTNELQVPFGVDLLLVERARLHLKFILDSPTYRDMLWVPDGSRKIFEKAETLTATARLYSEVDQLAKDIYAQLDPLGQLYDRPYSQVLSKAVFI